ncbi:hypothetical protein HY312_03760, partial [Candidatus Saccharibacteria bacterium]|nr:hypothetical protein [Candidatus Saccharibacteria bacterium]
MSNKIRLPDHYGQTIGSMNADEITLVHPVAIAADYLTRGIYIDPTYTLDDTPPNTEGVYSLSELQNRIPIMRLYGSSDGYVADLSSAQRARIELKEIEEAHEGSDFVSYPHADVDMHDYNEF